MIGKVLIFLMVAVFSIAIFSVAQKQIPAQFLGGKEIYSPSDWVKEDQIKVYGDKVVMDIPGATWASFTDTNSMDPFIDETSNAIEIRPSHPDSIRPGDIISFRTSYGTVIHRVQEAGKDEEGFFYIVKGDNNTAADPYKVRFDDVKGVVVAVVY
ncbi:hypothetical protein HYX14_04795 [Candidatus Woesearchaeota archaeon]|nr:hypothetical protein [Candidatus Woesearchaeota archaeon]